MHLLTYLLSCLLTYLYVEVIAVCCSYTFPTMQQIGEDLVNILDQLQYVIFYSNVTIVNLFIIVQKK